MTNPTDLSPARLDRAIAELSQVAPHWVPILRAMKSGALGFTAILPSRKRVLADPRQADADDRLAGRRRSYQPAAMG